MSGEKVKTARPRLSGFLKVWDGIHTRPEKSWGYMAPRFGFYKETGGKEKKGNPLPNVWPDIKKGKRTGPKGTNSRRCTLD